jgi:hypothetical protein
LYLRRAFFESKLEMIEARDPLANEKDRTPKIIMMQAYILSIVLVVYTSPYPTVVIV